MAEAVHPRAAVAAGARLEAGVTVGPFAVVGPEVRLGPGCVVEPHAVLDGAVTLGPRCRVRSHVLLEGQVTAGADNVFGAGAVVGSAPQDKRYEGGPAPVVLGDGNVLREHVTVHGGTAGATLLGSHNLLMAGVHVAHDARIGSHCVLANGVQIAGHAVVEDYVVFGGLAGVAQLVSIGEGAFVAAGAMVERAVPPFVIVQGDRARVRALNVVGLRRRGVAESDVAALERVFRRLFRGTQPRAVAAAELLAELRAAEASPWVERLLVALVRGAGG